MSSTSSKIRHYGWEVHRTLAHRGDLKPLVPVVSPSTYERLRPPVRRKGQVRYRYPGLPWSQSPPSPPPPPPGRNNKKIEKFDLDSLLGTPSWSVRSLVAPVSSSSSTSSTTSSTTTTSPSSPPPAPQITPQTLHHLLRLSALPPPATAEEESSMLSTLESQLHFVRAIRDVDTAGVEPLRAIRDETEQGVREQTVGLEALRDALAREDVVGHARRPRRRRREEDEEGGRVEQWDVLGGASETTGRYFVVRSGSGSATTGKPGSHQPAA